MALRLEFDDNVTCSESFFTLVQGPWSNFEIGGGTISDSILGGYTALFLTNSSSHAPLAPPPPPTPRSLWLHVQRETGLICRMKPYVKSCTVCDKSCEFDVET